MHEKNRNGVGIDTYKVKYPSTLNKTNTLFFKVISISYHIYNKYLSISFKNPDVSQINNEFKTR